jgi:hypothetical protein
MSRTLALEDFLRRYLERHPDMRSISLSTAEGTHLYSGDIDSLSISSDF